MSLINRAASGVDPTAGRYTVYVPPSGNIRAPMYVVYDNLTEAQNDVNVHKFGTVYTANTGALAAVYAHPAMSTYRPPVGVAPVVIGPVAAQMTPQQAAARANVAQPIPTRPMPPVQPAFRPGVQPASTWGWLSPVTAATTNPGNVTSGSLRLVSAGTGPKGADVQLNVTSMRGNDTVRFSIGAQVNGNWVALYNIATQAALTPGWQTVTLHVNYEEVNAYLKSVNPALALQPGQQVAIGATFSTGHNTGMPGWTSNNGSEQNIFVTLPPPG